MEGGQVVPTAEEKNATSADLYFDQKARFSAHEMVLKDRVRQRALHSAIGQNQARLQGATVLVIGSGLGVVPFQLIRAGAARVVGVESSAIVHQARQLSEDNGFSEVITFVGGVIGKDADIPLGPQSVDAIFCEWFGHLGTNDPILRQLIKARDMYLKPDGVIVPNKLRLYLSACQDRGFKTASLDFWDNVYGFTMRAMKKLVLREPVVSLIPPGQMVCRPFQLASFDATTVTEEELTWEQEFTLTATKNREYIHYLVCYFSVELSAPGWSGFRINTAPEASPTHWQQTAFTLKEDLPINQGDTITGKFRQQVSKDGSDTFNTIDVKLDTNTHKTAYSQDFHFRN